LANPVRQRTREAPPVQNRREPARVKSYPYAFHFALDGNGINELEGMAGVCLFLFDPVDNRYAYKIACFDQTV
jgi:hypothetical protein